MMGYNTPGEFSAVGERHSEAVVIGASAGAVEALSVLLKALPADFSLPVLVVVHLPRDRESTLAELFQSRCRVKVKEAEDKEPVRGGVVYFAPPDYHLLVEAEQRLSLSSDEPVLYSRPSIDVLFEAAADVYGAGLVGMILTGASSDGAKGLQAVCRAGGRALVQDPATAVAPAMPHAALQACPTARKLTLDQMAACLQDLTGSR